MPEDIGFASLEVYPEHGPLAGIDQKSITIGATAVELVIEQLYHNQRGLPENPKTVMIEGRWQPGETIRAIGPPSPDALRGCAEAISWPREG